MKKHLSTYLSENIYEVIINLRSSYSCVRDVVDENLLLNWKNIDIELEHISESGCILDNSREWYKNKLKILWGIMLTANEKFIKCTDSNKEKLFSFSSWVFNRSEIEDIYKKFERNEECELLFCVLKMTSYLDRALGDVYTSTCAHVPFLLKDMLASDVLIEVFGATQVKFLQLLLGTVKGMNLRNIAWHGFFSPGEINQSIISMLFLLIAPLGVSLKNFEKRPTIKSESLKKFGQNLEHFFYEITLDCTMLMEAVMSCPFISKKHHDYWKYSFDLYTHGRHGDSLIFLMPLKESILRSAFCYANNCSGRMLTAEAETFYTTMDDVLAPQVGSTDNRLQDVIGLKILEMLLDLYIYEEGPRLRDRISHSEIKPYDVPENIARCVFDINILLIITINIHVKQESPELMREINTEYNSRFAKDILKYEPQFHPTCFFKRSLLDIVLKLARWDDLPLPAELSHLRGGDNDIVSLFESITDFKDFINYSIDITSRMRELKPKTVFRPKSELELISMLRKIVSFLMVVNDNVVVSCESKRLLWENKQMKSRNRENYKRMLDCLSNLQLGIGCIINTMFIALKELHNYKTEETKKIHRICQKYAENAATMSSHNKNRWKELKESTVNVCNVIISVPLFLNK